jgi:hypothetical protein
MPNLGEINPQRLNNLSTRIAGRAHQGQAARLAMLQRALAPRIAASLELFALAMRGAGTCCDERIEEG